MKKLLVTALLSSAFFCGRAQYGKNVEKQLFKVNAFLPGISYELAAGNSSTFNFDAELNFGLRGASGVQTQFGFYPGLVAEFRNYNNFNRRVLKGKNIAGNSANYFGLYNRIVCLNPIIGDLDYSSSYVINTGVVYGFQRTYKKGFYWNLSFGPGMAIEKNNFSDERLSKVFTIVGNSQLGWIIRKRK